MRLATLRVPGPPFAPHPSPRGQASACRQFWSQQLSLPRTALENTFLGEKTLGNAISLGAGGGPARASDTVLRAGFGEVGPH